MKQSHVKPGRFPAFKDRLNILMGEMNTTEFAKHIGLSRQTTGFYLNGDRIPDAETLYQICQHCNVSADWLLGLAPEKAKTSDISELAICKKTGLSSDAVENLIGTNEYGKHHFISTIDFLLRTETQWRFLAPDEGYLDKERSLLEVLSDYLYTSIPTGYLMVSNDGKVTELNSTEGKNGLIFLPSDSLGIIKANEIVDTIRIDRVIKALSNARTHTTPRAEGQNNEN